MRDIGLAGLLLLISSCSYETHQPVGQFWFSFENARKTELMSILDAFAHAEGFSRLQDGGEGLQPEARAKRVLAVYASTDAYQFQVANILNEKCFSAAGYDLDNNNRDKARQISTRLQAHLRERLGDRLDFYQDQRCITPIAP